MKKRSYADVKEYIENFGYELLSKEYVNNCTKLDIRCDKGHEYKASFGNFQGGKRCPHCNGGISKWTKKMIKDYVISEGYIFVEFIKFDKYDSRILVQCPNEHDPYEVHFGNFYRGKRCEKCKRSKWGREEIIKYIEDFGYKFIKFIEFNKVLSKIEVECEKGHSYNVIFKKFLENRRCPYCNESKGEKEISDVLNKFNISYIPQYKFDDCRFYRTLPFDFYLPKYNICIEYDGQQHYEMVEHFGGFDKFVDTKIRDTIKNEYCKKNNIKLIRIPYWELDNIEKIIVNKLELE